jgi:chemosensory pili system protein ChpA (sensor histidine kinase/response regulator)
MANPREEELALRVSFAEEIHPLVSEVAQVLRRLMDEPGDGASADGAQSELRTLRGAVSMLELNGLGSLLDATRDALAYAGSELILSQSQGAAGRELADVLVAQVEALQRGEIEDAPLDVPAALLDRLRTTDGAADSGGDWLDSLPSQPGEPLAMEDGEQDSVDVEAGDEESFDEAAAARETHDAFARESVRLLAAMAAARDALLLAPEDEGQLVELNWASHTLRGAAMLVDAVPLAELCGLLERVAEAAVDQGPPLPSPTLAWIESAVSTIDLLLQEPDAIDGEQSVAALSAQLDQLGSDAVADDDTLPDGWLDLPPELAAELEDVDVASLDDAELDRLATLLEAHDARRETTHDSEAQQLERSETGDTIDKELIMPSEPGELDGDLDEHRDATSVPEVPAAEETDDAGGQGESSSEPDIDHIAAAEIVELGVGAEVVLGGVQDDFSTSETSDAVDVPPEPEPVVVPEIAWADLIWDSMAMDEDESGTAYPQEERVPFAPDDDLVDAELQAVFLSEAEEHLATINQALVALESNQDLGLLLEVRRAVHTLKGAAAVVGLVAVADFCHVWEDAMDALEERGIDSAPDLSLLLECAEALERYVRRLDDPMAPSAFVALAARLGATEPGIEAPPAAIDVAEMAWDASLISEARPDDPTGLLDDSGLSEAEFEAELQAVFLAEAEEHLVTISHALVALESGEDVGPLLEVRRAVHTLKGAAAAVGLVAVADFCHVWEDALDTVEERGPTSAPDLSLQMECAAALERYVRHPGDPTVTAAFVALAARLGAGDSAVTSAAAFSAAGLVPTETADETPADSSSGGAAQDAPAVGSVEMLRIPMARVDGLISLVGELVVQRSGLVQRLERLGAGLDDLEPALHRLRRVIIDLEDRFGYAGDLQVARRRLRADPGSSTEFDELEFDRYGDAYQLARELAELAADLDTSRRELYGLLDDARDGVVRQGRISNDLHDELLNVRLVPLAQLSARLHRTVRQASLSTGKQVAMVLDGGDTLVDKALLEEIADPLVHLLRNAVDHGIEPAEVREQQGKPSAGTVRVSATREGHEVVVRVQDDGAGIDPVKVLARARARGLVAQDAPDDPAVAYRLIFTPGFSTASAVTELSGRGIGLDAVRANLARAKGVVTVDSTVGRGTVFTLRIPALLVVTQALLVSAGGQRLALPLAQVRRMVRVPADSLVHVGPQPVLLLDGATFPVRYLGAALGWPSTSEEAPGLLEMVITASGDEETALVVDEILGRHETVVRVPAPPFDVLPHLSGTSVQGNGEVLLVVNALDLGTDPQPRRTGSTMRGDGAVAVRKPPTVLVVDDSLSVRRVVSRTLTRHGWLVREARDGAQALEVMPEVQPDVVLMDVEMPRMDGFELTAALKNRPEYQQLPIVMLTSRAGDKHRSKAAALGVDAYLVKPYQEAELVRVLRDVALAAPAEVA